MNIEFYYYNKDLANTQRYDLIGEQGSCEIGPYSSGDYIKFDDAINIVNKLTREKNEIEEKLCQLESRCYDSGLPTGSSIFEQDEKNLDKLKRIKEKLVSIIDNKCLVSQNQIQEILKIIKE